MIAYDKIMWILHDKRQYYRHIHLERLPRGASIIRCEMVAPARGHQWLSSSSTDAARNSAQTIILIIKVIESVNKLIC